MLHTDLAEGDTDPGEAGIDPGKEEHLGEAPGEVRESHLEQASPGSQSGTDLGEVSSAELGQASLGLQLGTGPEEAH